MAEQRRPCTRCHRNRAPRFFRSDRGRICLPCQRGRTQIASRDVRLQQTYGISQADYAWLFAEQDGKCAICKGTRRTNLDVEHSHALEKAGVPARHTIRGLCCRRCNKVLASMRDNPTWLRTAANYLERGVIEWPDSSI